MKSEQVLTKLHELTGFLNTLHEKASEEQSSEKCTKFQLTALQLLIQQVEMTKATLNPDTATSSLPEHVTCIIPLGLDYKQVKGQMQLQLKRYYTTYLMGLANGNMSEAARMSGIHQSNLVRMVRQSQG
jgi:hypothetical protein